MKCWKCGKETTLKIYKTKYGIKEEYLCVDDECGCIKTIEDELILEDESGI